jgi:hypothetical protein
MRTLRVQGSELARFPWTWHEKVPRTLHRKVGPSCYMVEERSVSLLTLALGKYPPEIDSNTLQRLTLCLVNTQSPCQYQRHL